MVIYKNNNEFDKSNVYIKGNKFIYDKFNKTKNAVYRLWIKYFKFKRF